MRLRFFHLDSFTSEVFKGNPAGVVLLERWLDDATLQAIAKETPLSATAFFIPGDPERRIRWFTPKLELELCGHATLAAGKVVLERLDPSAREVEFVSRRGPLRVRRDGTRLALDFPATPGTPCDPPAALAEALGVPARETRRALDLLVRLESEAEVRALRPNFAAFSKLDTRGVIVTAPGEHCDYVSRFFAPSVGDPEDPATGSAHCMLAPYWAERLGKTALHDVQLSERGGEFWCETAGDRVTIAGHAAFFLEGEITLG